MPNTKTPARPPEYGAANGSALGHVINAINALACGMNPVPAERVTLALDELRTARKQMSPTAHSTELRPTRKDSMNQYDTDPPPGWPPPCPHCGEELLADLERGLHCDGCDDLTAEDEVAIFARFTNPKG